MLHEVQLPGGLVCDGDRHRRVRLRPLDGRLELAIAESHASLGSRVAGTTAILGAVVESVGGLPGSPALAEQLCIADRQLLLVRLAELLHGRSVWVAQPCTACGERFDVEVTLAQLPVVEAGPGYPEVDVELEDRRVRVRVPSGRDQAALCVGLGVAQDTDVGEARAIRELAARCLDDETVGELSDEELARVDAALDRMSPAIATELSTACPSCEAAQLLEIDPYSLAVRAGEHGDELGAGTGIVEEIHELAFHYHWSEAEILALPRARRRRYVALIDRERGMGGG